MLENADEVHQKVEVCNVEFGIPRYLLLFAIGVDAGWNAG